MNVFDVCVEKEDILSPCPHCGLETGIVECDAREYPNLCFAVTCPRCGAKGPVHWQRFYFGEPEIAARRLFAERASLTKGEG